MKSLDQGGNHPAEVDHLTDPDPLLPLFLGRTTTNAGSSTLSGGIVVGELIGMTDDGRTPLVVYPGQAGSSAIAARSVLDLHGAHIGGRVVLLFEDADPAKPIIMGVLRDGQSSALAQRPGHVEVDSDGERMIVSAKAQLVLRCGKASITLTKAGKVLIEGAYITSRSTGVNRIKGGSIQLN
jgi:hypothetical protein